MSGVIEIWGNQLEAKEYYQASLDMRQKGKESLQIEIPNRLKMSAVKPQDGSLGQHPQLGGSGPIKKQVREDINKAIVPGDKQTMDV